VVGTAGLVLLLFFSSLAFTVLENAMSVIFFHRVAIKRRHFLVSAIIPYCYILLLAAGMLVVSTVSGALTALDTRTVMILSHVWSLDGTGAVLIYLFGVVGETALLTSLYLVMPVGRLALRHALIGGVTAALLWEITRHIMVWYFSTLSLVDLVYGTFSAAILILISLEAAAIILLLGAQVIAEYERIGTSPTPSHGLQT
jgi:membrane protein